ncbi:MAG: ABC transporter ATP-binding protein [Clostridiales bacterium]|nr:ABC transporter ATP-binding protein [Clostridiales bacterium]
MIEVRNLGKAYRMGEEIVVALRKIDLKIERGEICCVFGASGSGKSTLLNMLAGMEPPSIGEIFIDGVDITKLSENELSRFRQNNIGFIFQSYNLMQMMTAAENVALPMVFCGIDKARREAAARSVLKAVGLGDRINHYPTQMSGGQQQRTGIARAFVTKPKIIFADEPTGNLDTKTTKEIMDMMVGFAKKYNETMILVTHNPKLADYADRIITLSDGEITGDERIRHDEK